MSQAELNYKELVKGDPLTSKGEIVKCKCGGTYRWTGAIKPSYDPIYLYKCDKCNRQASKKLNIINIY